MFEMFLERQLCAHTLFHIPNFKVHYIIVHTSTMALYTVLSRYIPQLSQCDHSHKTTQTTLPAMWS